MNKSKKVIFLDRDGTLIVEPPITEQVNSLEELSFIPYVISSLKKLYDENFELIIVTNQDKLGTSSNPREVYDKINGKMLEIFEGEGIKISHIFECPHTKEDKCHCRKPQTGMLTEWLKTNNLDRENSYMIGDRKTDTEFAKNLGIKGYLLDKNNTWQTIAEEIVNRPRRADTKRKTKETEIKIFLNLDGKGRYKIDTGINFFNHMLEQFSKHSCFDTEIYCKGDLKVDEHHTIEDVAIALGETFGKALGDKIGAERFAWERILVMDEAKAEVTIDLSGRSVFTFNAKFDREYAGDMPTETVEHFFHSFCIAAGINAYITLSGKNTHHMIEACFKAFAKTLKTAVKKTGSGVISTKGIL